MNLNYTLFLLVLSVFAPVALHAQERVRCGTDVFTPYSPPVNPRVVADWRAQVPAAKGADEIRYRIPVVFHVIHMNGPENISDAQIRSQIDVLNEDFQRMQGTRGEGPGSRLPVEFFLAQKDPSGECTSGINRIWSPFTYHGMSPGFGSTQEQLVNLAYWNPERYLNVWLVHSISNNVLAYANVGYSGSGSFDGVVMASKNTGRVGSTDSPYNLGRTLTHEVGHWLGLLHTFTGGCQGWSFPECGWQGDQVCDTPQYEGVYYSCAKAVETPCPDYYPPPQPTLPTNNYMGYSEDSCLDAFTQGQVDRMDSVLAVQRTRIWSEDNLIATGYYGCVTSVRARSNAAHVFGAPYPNPGTGRYAVSCSSRQAVDFEIHDLTGRLLLAGRQTPTEKQVLLIDAEALPAGVYQLTLTGENGQARQSFRLLRTP